MAGERAPEGAADGHWLAAEALIESEPIQDGLIESRDSVRAQENITSLGAAPTFLRQLSLGADQRPSCPKDHALARDL